jgi:uncharacterized protein (TIGR02996 family)
VTAAHDTRAALLAAVIAHPDEDTPRLMYADWLQEYGDDADRARAEFVRVQVELARILVSAAGLPDVETDLAARAHYSRVVVLSRRVRELWNANWHVWCFELPPGFRPILPDVALGMFRRGFVEHVTCDGDDWVTHADAILASHPVRAVTLTSWPAMTFGGSRFAGGWCLSEYRVAGRDVVARVPESSQIGTGMGVVVYRAALSARWPQVPPEGWTFAPDDDGEE